MFFWGRSWPGQYLSVKRLRLAADAQVVKDRSANRSRPHTWKSTYQWVVGIAVVCLLAALTYSRAGWVPLLSRADLGIHEFGHLLFWWAPRLLMQLAGSLMQVGLPLLIGAYFLWRRERLGVVLVLAWAAESLNNVSVYVYDATRMQLLLVGDDGSGAAHDWRNILCSLDALSHTDAIAYTVRGVSAAMFAAAVGLAVLWWVQSRRDTPATQLGVRTP